MIDVRQELLAHAESDYAAFSKSLIPGDRKIIGVRLPIMREIAKNVAKDDWRSYIRDWEPVCFEDYMVRGLVIAYAKMDIDERLAQYESFVPYIDNWSVCDSFCMTWKPKPKEKDALWDFILPYLDTDDEFRMRFAVIMMMDHFMDDDHIDRIIGLMDSAHNDGYYLKMGVAWNLSVCFVHYSEKTMAYLKGKNNLDEFTYLKTLQKIIESYRVSDEMKDEIRLLRSEYRASGKSRSL